jgi:hypothetical protein
MSNKRCDCVFFNISPHRKSKCSLNFMSGSQKAIENNDNVDTSLTNSLENDDKDQYAFTAVEATVVPGNERIYASAIEPYPGDHRVIEGVPLRGEIPTTPLKEVSFGTYIGYLLDTNSLFFF